MQYVLERSPDTLFRMASDDSASAPAVWALHGVWDPFTSMLLLPSYFSSAPLSPSRPVSFVPDYWRPSWEIWARKIRKAHPECIHFIQPPVFHQPPVLDEDDLGGRACVSCHYYDGLTLLYVTADTL